MKVYVAGAWVEQHQRARPMIAKLRAVGIEITCDWTIAEGTECGKPATHVIEWKNGDRSPMCLPCALLAQELAESHGSRVSVKSR